MTNEELTHFKKMVRVWKNKSLLFCLRYDPLIVFRRQNHIAFIFMKTMSHDPLVQMAYADIQEFWNFQCQTFNHFSKLYLSFPDFVRVWKMALQISRLFQEFKTLHGPRVRLFFAMSFCFCLEALFSFLCEFLFLLWGLWFCREVFGFAWSICFCREERYFLLLWQLWTTVDKGVCSHMLLDSKLAP